MKVIGITGGIGSGKSAVSSLLARCGAAVIDADVVARDVVKKGEAALEGIVKNFGTDVLDSDGELDRKKLAEIVFGNKKKLHELNAITHKYIIGRIKERIQTLKAEKITSIAVLEVQIPFGNEFREFVDKIWVVTANRNIRIKRIMDRSGMTREEAIARIDSQLNDEEYLKLADEVISNNGSIGELEARVRELLFSLNQSAI